MQAPLNPSPQRVAAELLKRIRSSGGPSSPSLADELLLFLYRLKDRYRVLSSTSKAISGRRFTVLGDVIYQLESQPDSALSAPERRAFIETLLSDLASGRIVIEEISA